MISTLAVGIIAALAALGGALGSQWLARGTQREQLASADERELGARRLAAYEEFLTALHALIVAEAMKGGNPEMAAALQRVFAAYSRVEVLGSDPVRAAAQTTLLSALGSIRGGEIYLKDPRGFRGLSYPKLVNAVRAELNSGKESRAP